jgi:hypothetical protein
VTRDSTEEGSLANWASRVRGSLPLEGAGARGLERLARNPSCLRLITIVASGASPARVAAEAYRSEAEGQSPFAIGAGNQFERRLYDRGGARLLELYRAAGRLEPCESKVVNVAERIPGRTREVMGRRAAETLRLLKLKLDGDAEAPNLIIKPRLEIPLLGVALGVEPDHLIGSTAERAYRIAEVKAYPDRRGKTDMADLRGALRQAAVGVLAMWGALETLHAPMSDSLVEPKVDLVLRRPGSFIPTLNSQAVVGEIDSLQRTLRGAPAFLRRATPLISPGETLAQRDVLERIPNNYNETCKEHCPLARGCKAQALALGDPVILGSSAKEMLAAAGTVPRALQLLRGDRPRSAQERALQTELRTADGAYAVAVNDA